MVSAWLGRGRPALLWVITLAGMGYLFRYGMTSKSTSDLRTIVQLTPEERDLVLGEMRTILGAVNGVLSFSSQGDLKGAADAAKSAGMVMAVDVQPAFLAKLPLEFKKLGMGLHEDFDLLSRDLSRGMTEREILARLGAMTQKCIACHAAYRFPNHAAVPMLPNKLANKPIEMNVAQYVSANF